MAKIPIANAVRPAIKTVDRDEDTFSFEALVAIGKLAYEGQNPAGQGPASAALILDSPADFLFANGQLLPHEFRVPSDSGRLSISKDTLAPPLSGGSSRNSRQSSEKSKGSDRERVAAMPTSTASPVKRRVAKHVRFRSRDDVVPPPKWQASPSVPSPESSKAATEISLHQKVDEMKKKRRPKSKNEARGRSSKLFCSFGVCRECRTSTTPSKQVEGSVHRRVTWHTQPSHKLAHDW